MIGRQQVTGISAARCVFPIPFVCYCVYEFSLSPCPHVQVRFQKKLQDLFEMEPARIRAHYRTCLASGDVFPSVLHTFFVVYKRSAVCSGALP